MLYVLVGGPFSIVDTPHQIEIFGHPFEIAEELAHKAISEGAPILPKEQFDSFSWTPEELKFTNARLQTNAPHSWREKRDRALAIVRENLAKLNTPKSEDLT